MFVNSGLLNVKKVDTRNKLKFESKLYSKFRVIGRVSDGVPVCLHYNGQVGFITSSIEGGFHVYDLETLNLMFLGNLEEQAICIRAKNDSTFIATEREVILFERAIYQKRISIENVVEFSKPVQMEIIGDDHLLILTSSSFVLIDLEYFSVVKSVPFNLNPTECHATCFTHPISYLNKIVIGFSNGSIQLWNVKTQQMIYSFKAVDAQSSSGGITFARAAPYVDIVALGFEDGQVKIIDIKTDKCILSLNHTQGSVTSISFRTGGGSQHLAVGLSSGLVAIWDLDRKALFHSFQAHSASVSSLEFIHGEPKLLSSSSDNSIREWLIENGKVLPLKYRAGHAKPPRMIRYYGEDDILSVGEDRSFRLHSMIKDSQSSEISQGSVESIANKAGRSVEEIKLDPICSFSAFCSKDLKWDNVVTAHEHSAIARSWRVEHKKIGKFELPSKDGAFISCVFMSTCGNFALLGSEKGNLSIYNIQSGILRKYFSGPESRIVGIGSDSLNENVILVHQNGSIRMIDMVNGSSRFCTNVESNYVLSSDFHPDTQLLVVSYQIDDGEEIKKSQVVVIDVQSGVVGRRFSPFPGKIIDCQITKDSRWIICASDDCSIRTLDLATGFQIDQLPIRAVPSSICVSPNGDYIAVIMENDVGIHIWANLSLYKTVELGVISTHEATFPLSCDFLNDGFVSLSLEPRQKWTSLYNLEEIKSHNKPILPQRANEGVPFFLDVLLESESTNKKRAADEKKIYIDTNEKNESLKIQPGACFQNMLSDTSQEISKHEVFKALLDMTISQVDFEIRSISLNTAEGIRSFQILLQVLVSEIATSNNFELALTFLNIAIKAHLDQILKDITPFKVSLESAIDFVGKTWSHSLEPSIQQTICLVHFLRDRL